MTLLERLGIEHPVVQAGMGGGISTAPLAAAVSAAGGLGTIGIVPPARLAAELRAARAATDRPVAVNLLLPFARPAHWTAAEEADVVVTFWGAPARRTARAWLHQCGSVQEARAAVAAGADGVILQGVEAGGHVRGTTPALELLAEARAVLDDDVPLWLAGGIADRADVTAALAAGAEAAVLGTRFLLSEESAAHPAYRDRALAADGGTVLTELFGSGWPASHRVLPNAATRRWLRGDSRGPRWLRALNGAGAPVLGRVPLAAMARLAVLQRPWLPATLTPQPPVTGMPERVCDALALYAGETVARIDEVRPAGDLVRELAGAGAEAAA